MFLGNESSNQHKLLVKVFQKRVVRCPGRVEHGQAGTGIANGYTSYPERLPKSRVLSSRGATRRDCTVSKGGILSSPRICDAKRQTLDLVPDNPAGVFAVYYTTCTQFSSVTSMNIKLITIDEQSIQ